MIFDAYMLEPFNFLLRSGKAKHKLTMAINIKEAKGIFAKKKYETEHGINMELSFVDSLFMMFINQTTN